MSYDDIRRLTVDEFQSVVKEWQGVRESDYQDRWERMRMLATITIQPHTKKAISPKVLLPFPWEQKKKRQADKAPLLSKEEHKKRFLEFMQRRQSGIAKRSV